MGVDTWSVLFLRGLACMWLEIGGRELGGFLMGERTGGEGRGCSWLWFFSRVNHREMAHLL